MMKFLEETGVSIWLMVSGFFGALLALKDKKGLTKRDKVISVLSGMLIANYVTPLVFEYLKINNGAIGGIAFLLGYSGLELIKWIIYTFKKKVKTRSE